MSQLARALLTQVTAAGLLWLVAVVTGWRVPSVWLLALCAGALSALLAARTHDARWWVALHLVIPPALLAATQLPIAPVWWLLAAALTFLLFGAVGKTRVPLYLSHHRALAGLARQIPQGASVVDLGAGTGTVVAWLARYRPDVRACGVEAAWLPWLLGRVRLAGRPVCWLRGDLFAHDLTGYDVVYAYLSPAAMPDVWHKFSQEAKPGALLVSNSFAVPGVDAEQSIDVGDWKGGELLLWHR
ncbi:class I SAM-dependent methyltransferase [Chitinibacteraceae bacterium HSL-7]